MEIITRALILNLFFSFGCAANEISYVQVTSEPTPDIIPYESLSPLMDFLDEHDLREVKSYKFFVEFAKELESVIVYGQTLTSPTSSLLSQCQTALKKDDGHEASICAQAAVSELMSREHQIQEQDFGFMSKTITAEIHELGEKTDIFYITVENDQNYLLSAKPGIELKAGKVCEMEGLLSIVSDKSFRHFNKHLSREFVVSSCKAQHK